MTADARVPLGIGIAALATTGLFATEAGPPFQGTVAIAFLLVGPGLAWVRLLRLGDRAAEWTIAVVASIAIDGAVATALLTTGLWTPARALGTIVVVTIAGSMLDVWPGLRWRPTGHGELSAGGAGRHRGTGPGRFDVELKHVAGSAVIVLVVLRLVFLIT